MIYLLTVSLILLSPFSVLAKDSQCDILATFGSTKINVTWEPCDEASGEPVSGQDVILYFISLQDNSKYTFNQSATVDCRLALCEYTFDLVKPCLNYTISLVMTMRDNKTNTYTTVTARTEEEIPTSVIGLRVGTTTESSINISWFPPDIGKYCVNGYQISWWNSYGGELSMDSANVTDIDHILEDGEQTFVLGNLSACSNYQLMVTPVYSSDSKRGHGVVESGRTQYKDPQPPSDLRVTYRGYDFMELDWSDAEDTSCVRGVSVSCSVISEGEEGGLSSLQTTASQARKGRVTHLSPCTNYSCSVSYPDSQGSWSLSSSPVSEYTWVKGVTISQPTRVRYYMTARDLYITWGGPEQGGRCVTEYRVKYTAQEEASAPTEEEEVSVMADGAYLLVIKDTAPATQYNFSITAASTGWGDEVTGETVSYSLNTGAFDVMS